MQHRSFWLSDDIPRFIRRRMYIGLAVSVGAGLCMVGLPLLGDRAAGYEWFVALPVVAGFLLILDYRRFLKQTLAKRKAGVLMCWHCGYDLGATASPGRCPECGTDFERAGLQQRWQKMRLR